MAPYIAKRHITPRRKLHMQHSPNRIDPNYLKLAESLAATVENPACPFSLQLEILAWFNGLDHNNIPKGPTLPSEDADRIRERLPLLSDAIFPENNYKVDHDDDERPFDRMWALDLK
jgi:hypothetical protein